MTIAIPMWVLASAVVTGGLAISALALFALVLKLEARDEHGCDGERW